MSCTQNRRPNARLAQVVQGAALLGLLLLLGLGIVLFGSEAESFKLELAAKAAGLALIVVSGRAMYRFYG